MNVLYILVPLALLLAGAGVWAFFWAVRSGQFDDVETPAIRILLDDEVPETGRAIGEYRTTKQEKGEGRRSKGGMDRAAP